MRKLSLSLAVALSLAVVVVHSLAQKKAESSDAQYTAQALSAAPKALAKDAAVGPHGREWKNDNLAARKEWVHLHGHRDRKDVRQRQQHGVL
jgi:hypothetical protein